MGELNWVCVVMINTVLNDSIKAEQLQTFPSIKKHDDLQAIN
jgi:hypothetical protein